MLRIRLRRVGKKKQPMYRIVVADSRAPRDGAFVESIGYYHPLNNPSTIQLDEERARHWLDHGAQPSDRVSKILAIQGIRELPDKLKTRIALGEQRAKDAAAEKKKAKTEDAAEPKAEAKTEEAEKPKAEAKTEDAEKPKAEAKTEDAEKPKAEAKTEDAEKPKAEAKTEDAKKPKAEAKTEDAKKPKAEAGPAEEKKATE